MANEKRLVVMGLSEEDTAHLRLLLRMAATQMTHAWRWGTEDNADLIVVDPETFGGQMARNRAFSSGRRCAVLSSNEELRKDEVRLDKPMKPENVVAVFNAIAAATVEMTSNVYQQNDDFYDVGELSSQFDPEDDPAEPSSATQREMTPASGLEDLFKPDAAANKPEFMVPLQLKENTTFDRNLRVSARSDKRVADSMDGQRKPQNAADINLAPQVESDPAGTVQNHLRAYLQNNVLGGPAMMELENAPPLILDPKEGVYHSPAKNLPALSQYCTRALPRHAWRALTTAELTRVRAEQPAQPYSRLIWLSTLLRSGGTLASHLHPGGRYRLKKGTQIERDVARHAQVAAELEAGFSKINEIAAASRASMSEVFDLINAYDAIGQIQSEPHTPRHADPGPAKSGLLKRLRNSLSKR